MDVYRLGFWYSYTPDIEIEKIENKFGIIYRQVKYYYRLNMKI